MPRLKIWTQSVPLRRWRRDRNWLNRFENRSLAIAALIALPCHAQWTTSLKPRTVQEFQKYAKTVEEKLQNRWQGRQPFLSIDEDESSRKQALKGELVIHPAVTDNPVSISGGLIHDWVGTVYIPNAAMEKVLGILQDFDRHSKIYPAVIGSRLIRRQSNDLEGMWRLERKDPLLPVVLDVKQQAHYKQVAPGKWICRAYADRISEVENPGSTNEKILPPDNGTGFLWRLYAYWSLETVSGGILAECRTVSLSRDIPTMVNWIIRPFVQKLPRESLASTLEDTRSAASK